MSGEIEALAKVVYLRDQARGRFWLWTVVLVVGFAVAFIFHATWGAYLAAALFFVVMPFLWWRDLYRWAAAARLLRGTGL